VRDVSSASCIKIVDAEYLVPESEEAFTEKRAEKTGAAGHQDTLSHHRLFQYQLSLQGRHDGGTVGRLPRQ
jgi:hypothetical protein